MFYTIFRQKYLDIWCRCDIESLTCSFVRCGAHNATRSGNQSQDACRGWCAQLPSGAGSRPEVLRSGVLRSNRPGSGQVRNVASRIGRWYFDYRCHTRVRGVTADFLPGQSESGCGWPCRVGSEKTRASRPSQTQGRNHDIPGTPCGSGAADPLERACKAGPGTLWSRCPSTNHRARVAGKKNGATQERIAHTPVVAATTPTERYEWLRRHAIGNRLVSEDRIAAALFCRRGLLRWACTAEEKSETIAYRPDTNVAVPNTGEAAIIVHLLAQIAIATRGHRRTG